MLSSFGISDEIFAIGVKECELRSGIYRKDGFSIATCIRAIGDTDVFICRSVHNIVNCVPDAMVRLLY